MRVIVLFLAVLAVAAVVPGASADGPPTGEVVLLLVPHDAEAYLGGTVVVTDPSPGPATACGTFPLSDAVIEKPGLATLRTHVAPHDVLSPLSPGTRITNTELFLVLCSGDDGVLYDLWRGIAN